MTRKLSNFVLSLFILLGVSNYLEANAGIININKNLLTRFCLKSLKSKVDNKDFKKIASFTCECFYKKFSSGYSISNSKFFCKEKASEKFNL